ncbi:MAG TPA: HAMP domain-containing histidine kinase [Campylobacterales bacterium]|nr:HAMP domain-containing histidine kinase [Campylobacterales bacterium]
MGFLSFKDCIKKNYENVDLIAKVKIMIKNQKSKYHPELVDLYMEGVPASLIIGNFIIPLLFVYAIYGNIPNNLLMYLSLLFLTVSFSRFFISSLLKKAIFDTDRIKIEKYMNYTILSMFAGGGMWSAAMTLVYLYAPSEYLFFTATIIIGLTSASTTTLTPIFKSFLFYVLSALPSLIITFFLVGGKLFIAFSLMSLFFTIFIIVGGKKHYKKLYEAILLKDQLKLLNDDLEGEVKIRTLELEALNSSLEDKVEQEIDKNRVKDQQMIEQSRMAQMGEMISMIAHQWRQPLGAIASTSIDLRMKMMLESYDLDDKEQQKECTAYLDEQLVNVEGYVQSLTQTIDDFRNFYKPDKKQKVGLVNEPIQKSLDIIRATVVSNGTEIIESYESKQKLPLFDSELMQVFLNILKNAQDNFKEKDTQSAKIMIKTVDIENGIKVELCDNGGGIPEDIIAKIFDPYFSTKNEKNGTGLGLYMSKTIVEEHHNGKLSVENRDGGACFIIELRD